MEKTYKKCTFKLGIPKLLVDGDKYRVVFTILAQPGIYERQLFLEQVKLCDSLKHELTMDSELQSITIGGNIKRENITIHLKQEAKFLIKDAKLIVSFIDKSFNKRTTTYFTFKSINDCIFEGLELTYLNKYEEINLDSTLVQETIEQPREEEKATNKQNVVQKNVSSRSSFIDKYKALLYKEVYFLQNNGGRQYKVISGEFISKENDVYAYCFQLETELHLSDDAPIRLKAQGIEVTGQVLVCEDFFLIVLLNQKIGEKIPVAYISVEPWKLLKAQANWLDKYYDMDSESIARKLVDIGPQLSEKTQLDQIKKGQQQAIDHALNEPITIVWGPPGTGKTYTMSHLALRYMKQGLKVLIVSQSNVSVDGVIKKIVDIIEEKQAEKLLTEGKVLRVGYVRDEELAKHPYATSFNYCLNKYPNQYKEVEELRAKKKKLYDQGRQGSSESVKIEEKIKKIREVIADKEKEILVNANIIATTISKVTIDKFFENKTYDVVMFDEVSMAYVSQIFVAASMATKHFIAVGDFRQLPPIAQSESRVELENDIFSFLKITDALGNIYNHPWLVMLFIQRRMHPNIANFVSHYIYEDLLKTERKSAEQIQIITNRLPFSSESVIHFDLTGIYCPTGKNSDNSRFNVFSAFLAFYCALDCEKRGKHNVGIITPYAAQMRLIRAMIQDYKSTKPTDIICSTVHQFQGSERETIIFDAIENYPFQKPGVLLNYNENNRVTRLINVAVTRAKGKFISIADNRFWINKLDNKSHPMYQLMQYEKRKGSVLNCRDIKAYLSQESNSVITTYIENEYIPHLINDIKGAQENITISLPSGELMQGVESIEKQIVDSIRRGIRVSIKCKEYDKLPILWKKMSIQSEEADFPLILIDRKTIWYGVPEAKNSFFDKNSRYLAITPIIFRVKGRYTAEMLGSLTSVDELVVNSDHRQLIENIRDKGLIPTKKAGLRSYIEDKFYCKECKEHLTLKKGRTGKFYLGCIKCDYKEYLTPEIIDCYINMNGVQCARHGDTLKGRVGQYGVYVYCNCGDERHILKPDEI